MRAIVQRVSSASVSVDGQVVGRCGLGLLVLVGVHRDDCGDNAGKLAQKIVNLRIFSDEAGKMNLSLLDLTRGSRVQGPGSEGDGPGILAVSNFTVYGDVSKNRRPSFIESAGFEQGRLLFERFVEELRSSGLGVGTGVFGAHMEVALVNDGPVTLTVDV